MRAPDEEERSLVFSYAFEEPDLEGGEVGVDVEIELLVVGRRGEALPGLAVGRAREVAAEERGQAPEDGAPVRRVEGLGDVAVPQEPRGPVVGRGLRGDDVVP